MENLKELVSKLGVLRTLLAMVILWFVVSAPFAGEIDYSGWSIVPTLLVPVLVPIVFFVLPMDIIMSRVIMSEGEARARLKAVIITDVVLLVVLLLVWAPYFVRLLRIA